MTLRVYENIEAGTKKPLVQLLNEGLIVAPHGKKLNKTGTDFIDLSEAEKVEVGLLVLKDDEKVENGYIVPKSKKELYDEGKLSKEEYISISIRCCSCV